MSKPVFDPGNGGDCAARDVAELITALHLPSIGSIGSFGPGSPTLAGLPDYTVYPFPVPEPASRVSVARAVRDCAVAALAALKALEDRTAACKAAVVDRLMAATSVEATALALDPWQSGVAETTAIAEIATTLCIAEGTAKALVHYSTELLTLHPETLASLDAGALSWRHACTIVNETQTLAETPSMHPADIAEFETRLLASAPGTTAAGFASKSRRMREGTHPETLITRVREAISTRSLALEPGKDGMSWLILHIPATAANGVFINCTRTARAQQGPTENRTLGQLRTDTATALLLGQHPLADSGNATGQDPFADSGKAARRDPRAGSGKASGRDPRAGSGSAARQAPSTRGGGGWADSKSRQGRGTADTQSGNPAGQDPPAATDSAGAGSNQHRDGQTGGNQAGGAQAGGGPGGAPSGGMGDVAGCGSYGGFRLVDVVPDWAHGPREPMIGPLTEAADARADAWASAPENICLSGTVCPDIPTQTVDDVPENHGGDGGDGGDADGADAAPEWKGYPNTAGGHGGDGGPGPNPEEGTGGFPAYGGSAASGGLWRDGSGLVEGVVDGIPEDPVQEYLDQLEATRNGSAVTDPPEPEAQIIVTVPVLGLLGLTNEPAQLSGHGPIPEEIARKLLRNAGSFLRVLTDPISGTPLKGVPPERYRLRDAQKTLLRALSETCSFPNCTNPAIDSETDHIRPYSQGGDTTLGNVQPLCKRHHALRHFRDDKDRHGRYRQDLDPSRASIKLRGWKPVATPDGGVGWTSPSGKYHPPRPHDTQAPAYPKWLKKHLDQQPSPDGQTATPRFGTGTSPGGP